MARPLRLGTRGSPLALAQARLVAALLGKLDPPVSTTIVPLSTRGDRDRTTPLPAVDDPDFFSAELDAALLDGRVDFCVHSAKDLPPARPAGIVLAATPARENPRDVVVFRNDVQERLRAGQALRIGTSAERRRRLVADFLPRALPHFGRDPVLSLRDLRGPVDARLDGLHRPDSAADALDGAVLALAGLARLWNDPETRPLVTPRLKNVRWMVLPLTESPAAPAQGALAVECRADDSDTRALLAQIHDAETATLLAREAAAIQELPAAERADAGATAVTHPALGALCFRRSISAAGKTSAPGDVLWDAPPPPAAAVPFDGIGWQRLCRRKRVPVTAPVSPGRVNPALFVAYWHALDGVPIPADARVWTSGAGSWRHLARQGVWVEGGGDQLGFQSLVPTLQCPVLGLPPLAEWTVLTYRGAVDGWRDAGIGRVLASYDIEAPEAGPALDDLKAAAARATHYYWSSPDQFRGLASAVRTDAHHACGAGKTLATLKRAGIEAHPFPSGREWQQWLAQN